MIRCSLIREFNKHTDAQYDTRLFWEYDVSRMDFEKMRNVVVQRVVERGWPQDWWAMLNMYGEKGVKAAILEIPYLNAKDMNFVHFTFNIPLEKMKCYIRKQSRQIHWES